jgi:F0F1-type ATP synthase assembly protein I
VTKPPLKNNHNNSQSNKSNQIESFAQAYRKFGPYLNIGMVWALSVLFFTWIGIKLDEYWEIKPWLTTAGAVFGIITGFYHFIKTVMTEDNNKKS